MKNLFFTIMEAEGEELESFDPNTVAEEEEAPAPPSEDTEGPPEMSEDLGDDDLGFSPDGEEADMGGDTTEEPDGSEDEKNNEKLSEKANNILNQKLYKQFNDKNEQISNIIDDMQTISPILDYDVMKVVDTHIAKLKTALATGKKYSINKFINATYGENLMFYQKLDALYTLLMDSINDAIKKK